MKTSFIVYRKFLFAFVLLWGCFLSGCKDSSHINILIDERVELTSIVFRLAGAEEICQTGSACYVQTIESFFAQYKDHPLISFVKEQRERYDIGYSWIPSSAFLFRISDNRIVLNKDVDIKKYAENGWNYDSIIEYVSLMDSFFQETQFQVFYSEISELAKESIKKSKEIMKDIDSDWFKRYYGKPLEEIDCILGLSLGCNNFSLLELSDITEKPTIVMGCINEINGTPIIGEGYLPVLIHEINHIFANPLYEEYLECCVDSFSIVYPSISSYMEKIGYGNNAPDIALCEWLVNLCTVEYLIDNKDWHAQYEIEDLENRGFIWMNNSIHFMENFKNNRDKFISFESFMPYIVNYVKCLPSHFEDIMLQYYARCPYVESTFPPSGSYVSNTIDKICFSFSMPMDHNFGFKPIAGMETIDTKKAYWSKDSKTLIVPLSTPMISGKKYGIELISYVYISNETKHRLNSNFQYTLISQ